MARLGRTVMCVSVAHRDVFCEVGLHSMPTQINPDLAFEGKTAFTTLSVCGDVRAKLSVVVGTMTVHALTCVARLSHSSDVAARILAQSENSR